MKVCGVPLDEVVPALFFSSVDVNVPWTQPPAAMQCDQPQMCSTIFTSGRNRSIKYKHSLTSVISSSVKPLCDIFRIMNLIFIYLNIEKKNPHCVNIFFTCRVSYVDVNMYKDDDFLNFD